LKKWVCIKAEHQGNVAEVIENYEAKGWRLHTYQTAGMGGAMNYTVNHYLLFEKGE